MILDITRFVSAPYIPIIVMVVLGLLLVACLWASFHAGLPRCLFSFGYLILLVVAIMFCYRPLYYLFASIGFWEALQANSGVLQATLEMVSPSLVYTIIALIIIVIFWFLIKFIITRICSSLFERTLIGMKLAGLLYGLFIFFISSVFILESFSSPMVIRGGQEIIDNTMVVNVYKKEIIDPVIEVLHEQKIMLDIDGLYLMADKNITQDNYDDYIKAMEHYELFLVNKDEYTKTLQENGSYSLDKINEAVSNLNLFVEVITSSNTGAYVKATARTTEDLSAWVDCFGSTHYELYATVKSGLERSLERLDVPERIYNQVAEVFL